MRTLFIISIVFICFSSFGQQMRAQEKNYNFSEASNVNSIVVEIPYANIDFVNGRLKKLLKGWGKHKESKGEHSSLMVEMKDMGKMPFNVYARLNELNNEIISIHFGIDLGGAFLSKREHPEQYKIMESEILNFASSVVKDWISSELKNEEKILNLLEKDQKDLEKKKEHLEKEIEDFKKRIVQNEKEIKENIDLQAKKKEAIQIQDKKVKKVEQKLKDLN